MSPAPDPPEAGPIPIPIPIPIRALATDYDGTLARDERVDSATLAALDRWRAAGRRLILNTGRTLEGLVAVFPESVRFDRLVVENGAVMHRPETGETVDLAEPPPPEFVATLRGAGVGPIAVGRVIVATWRPHETTVAATIEAMGLDLRLILNKRAVMVLPAGVDKGTGLRVALGELGISPEETAGVGDAENDLDFLDLCGVSAAVANALPDVRARCRVVLAGAQGAGVAELIGRILDRPGDLGS